MAKLEFKLDVAVRAYYDPKMVFFFHKGTANGAKWSQEDDEVRTDQEFLQLHESDKKCPALKLASLMQSTFGLAVL